MKDRGLGKKPRTRVTLKTQVLYTENRESLLKNTEGNIKAADEESHIPGHKFTYLVILIQWRR